MNPVRPSDTNISLLYIEKVYLRQMALIDKREV